MYCVMYLTPNLQWRKDEVKTIEEARELAKTLWNKGMYKVSIWQAAK